MKIPFHLIRSYGASDLLTVEDYEDHDLWVLGHRYVDMPASAQRKVICREQMGGYWWPILEDGARRTGGDFTCVTFNRPADEDDLHALRNGVVERQDLMFGYVDEGHLHAVFSNFKLADLGLQVWTQDDENDAKGNLVAPSKYKTVKRLKTLDRRVRLSTFLPHLRVKVIDTPDEFHEVALDGAGAISSDIANLMIEQMDVGGWAPVQEALMRRRMGRERVFNLRAVGGPIYNVQTKKQMEVFIKGNFVVRDDLGDGIDIVTSGDQLKAEISGGDGCWVLAEPQGPKPAYEDQQTLMNNQFLYRIGDVRDRLRVHSDAHMTELRDGESLSSVDDLLSGEQNVDFAWDEMRYSRQFAWVGSSLRLHFPDQNPEFWSPWFTERLGVSWISSLGLTTKDRWNKTARIPIPFAERAQLFSDLFVQKVLGLQFEVEPGHIRYCRPMRSYVVNADDWVNIVVPNHGGPDQDDFFALRWVYDDDDNIIVVATRNPNTRGEYSIWKPTDGDRIPGVDSEEDLDRIPKYLKKRRPKTITEAVDAGETNILEMPTASMPKSEAEPRRWHRNDVRRMLQAAYEIGDMNYGSVEVTVRAYNSATLVQHPNEQRGSEDMIDAFVEAGHEVDRKAAIDYRDHLLEEMKRQGMKIDPLLHKRLGDEDVLKAEGGPLTELKGAMSDVISEHRVELRKFTKSLEIPVWLRALAEHSGNAKVRSKCVTILKKVRSGMYNTTDSGRDIREAQENMLMPIIDEMNPTAKANFILVFWFVCLTQPTKTTKTISDQLIFGTRLFEVWLEAMQLIGIARDPYVNDDGRIDYHEPGNVDFDGTVFTLTCNTCGASAERENPWTVLKFTRANHTCNGCKS